MNTGQLAKSGNDQGYHASSKAVSNRPRRVLHIEYIDSRDVGDGLHVAIA